MLASFRRTMSGRGTAAIQRTQAIGRHMMSTSTSKQHEEPLVTFDSLLSVRTYKLNRPKKLNALNHEMLSLLRPKIEEWSRSDLCTAIWGWGEGRAFCAGGDVAGVVKAASDPSTRDNATQFFKLEFELDYMLAAVPKPYIAIMDGITMGGGVGLSIPANFRVATENTVFAMPETKIGYSPDVGASYFLSRLDGEMGTYLALTGDTLKGRAVFEHGFATHYIPSRRIPMLLESMSGLSNVTDLGLKEGRDISDHQPHSQDYFERINQLLEEYASEAESTPKMVSEFVGIRRAAIDWAFRHDKVEKIIEELRSLSSHNDPSISKWASITLDTLNLRSPTSLKVALRAIRAGRTKNLLQALEMELQIAAACCRGATPDFKTGVEAVLVERIESRPNWSPATLEEVTDEKVEAFFNGKYLTDADKLEIPKGFESHNILRPDEYALPTEVEVRQMVTGEHPSGGNSGLTEDELVAKFKTLYAGKVGVTEKVLEVARRRCRLVDNADGNHVWLRWKHSVEPPR